MRLLAPAVLLPIALALGVAACAEEPETPAAFPTEAVGPSGLPPPIYVSVSSGPCDDADGSGCEARCADGNADACARVRAAYRAAQASAAPAPASAAPLRVDTPRASVQFFGPVSTVNIAPVAAPPPPAPGG